MILIQTILYKLSTVHTNLFYYLMNLIKQISELTFVPFLSTLNASTHNDENLLIDIDW